MPTTRPNVEPLLPVLAALDTLLGGAAGFDVDVLGDTVTVGVYDHVPEGAAFPHVVIGETTQVPENMHDRFGHRVTVTLHIWSAEHGYFEALAIASHISTLLDHKPLVVDGFDVVAIRHEQTITMRDSDADLRHVPVRYAVHTELPPA